MLSSWWIAVRKCRVNNEISHWRVLIADFYLLLRVSKEIPGSYKKLVHNQKLKFCAHMGQFPQDGENGQNVAFFIFLVLCCDQTVWFVQLFSTVLERFCPLHSKNVFVLVLAHLEPELELFEVTTNHHHHHRQCNQLQTALARVLNELGPKRKHF